MSLSRITTIIGIFAAFNSDWLPGSGCSRSGFRLTAEKRPMFLLFSTRFPTARFEMN